MTFLREANDGNTMFSIKSRGDDKSLLVSPRPHTVCGANVLGALSPVVEEDAAASPAVQYEPLPMRPAASLPISVPP